MAIVSYNDIKNDLRNFEAVEKTRKKDKKLFTGQFIDMRVDPDTIPKGKYMYQTRHSDNGSWCTPVTVEPRVLVNFCGTIITDEEIEFPNPVDPFIPIKDFCYTD